MPGDIQKFLKNNHFAVCGASSRRHKYGNKVLRTYIQNNLKAYPIHPLEKEIEDLQVYKSVSDLPVTNGLAISIITPGKVTEKIVEEAIRLKINDIWMQPGAESERAVQLCQDNEINLIYGGPCLLVELGFQEK